MTRKTLWAVAATLSGATLMTFAVELGKLIPGPDDQIIAGAGLLSIVLGVLLKVKEATETK